VRFFVRRFQTSSTSICRDIGIVFQAKDDAALESKLNANNVAFYKMGTVTTEATLDLAPADIAKYRDIWFKTSFY
jgi:phosphoribosylformylglycinamidine synthase